MKKTVSFLMVLAMLLTLLPAAVAEEAEHEPVTITFGGWGDIVLLNEQIEAFEKKYPWITVDVIKPAGRDWYATDLTQLAAEGNMPDVFNIEHPLQAYTNGWCYDMTDLFLNDPEHVNYPQEYLQHSVVNDKLIALTTNLYTNCIELNLSLLEELNIPIPSYDWTIEEWADILQKTCVPGVCWGTTDLKDMMCYMLPAFMPGTTAAGYDKKDFSLTATDGMVECWSLFQDMFDAEVAVNHYIAKNIDYSWTTNEESIKQINDWMLENLGATDNLWERGKIAMRMQPSWAMNWAENNSELYSGFDYDVYPFPSVNEGEMAPTAVVIEHLSIAATTEHPEEAYLLVKYLSYDLDGYEARVDFMVNYDREAMIAKYPEIDPIYIPGRIMVWGLVASTEARADEIFAKMDLEGNNKEGLAVIFKHRNEDSYILPERYIPNGFQGYDLINWYLQDVMPKGVWDPATFANNYATEVNKYVANGYASYGQTLTYGWTEEFLADWEAKNTK